MKLPSRLTSIFAGLLYCLAIPVGSAWAQIALPPYGTINTVAGVSTSGYAGDGGPAIAAAMYTPQGLAVDASGNIYIADSQNNRIRKVTATTGIITTVAGNGTAGYSGDGILATSAELDGPSGVAVDADGNIFIADCRNNRIRKVTVSSGIITTVAGIGTSGYSGDSMLAASAELNGPSGVAVDASGNIYIADSQNNRIRRVTVLTGIITTFAGDGSAGYNGDAQPATSAGLNGPQNLVVDKYGNVYIADTLNNRVREVGLAGKITTVAGIGVAGYSGDGEQANIAKISGPMGLAMDAGGNLFFADAGNNRIREVTTFTGVITTVAGNSTAGFSGDGGETTAAELNEPSGVAVDGSGNLHITDGKNNRVRVVGGDKTGTAAATVTAKAVTPMADSACSPGTLSAVTGLPSSGGTWTATYTYTSFSFPGCVVFNAPLSSDVNWLTINFASATCSPNPAPIGFLTTCTATYNAAQNTGPSRQGTLTANYASAGVETVNILQIGPIQTLTVGVNGSGTVNSIPSGLSCPGTCSAGFPYGTTVNLTASPSVGYSFSGWSGACSGTGACTFTMYSSVNVSASFTPIPPTFALLVTQPSQTTPLSLGHSMTYAVLVSSLYGFTGTVALSVSGLPAGVTAQLSNAIINAPGSAILTLTSAYGNSTTFIGNSIITVTGTSGGLSKSANLSLVTRPLQYKGACGVL